MRLRFSRFTSSQKPYGYRADDGCESENKTKDRQVLKKRGIHVSDLWEWVREKRNVLTVRRAADWDIPVVAWDHCPERVNGRDIGPSLR